MHPNHANVCIYNRIIKTRAASQAMLKKPHYNTTMLYLDKVQIHGFLVAKKLPVSFLITLNAIYCTCR